MGPSLQREDFSSCPHTRAQLPCGMWDLSSPTRDQTQVPYTGMRILNHWTTREVPLIVKILHNHGTFTKTKKVIRVQLYQLNYRVYPQFISFSSNALLLIQDSIQDTTVHLIIKSVWSRPICNSFVVFPCLSLPSDV